MNDDYLRFNEQGLAEINPMASYNTQQEFIDNYRAAQDEKTNQIGEQTHALGSDLTAQYGGLHGPSDYWKSRYQTPQTESKLATLRTANQLQALNQLMQNDLANEAEKYNQAYRNYQKKARTYGSGSGSGGGNTTDGGDGGSGEKLNIRTLSGTDSVDVNDTLNTKPGDLILSGTTKSGAPAYKWTDPVSGANYILETPTYDQSNIMDMTSFVGYWPDGQKKTLGSTYTDAQGNRFIYTSGGNEAGNSTFKMVYDFGG